MAARPTRYDSIPSALSAEQISAVLKHTCEDRSPNGLRDYAILLLATYGLRCGEIRRVRLEDIDWRAEILHIRHSKTGANSQLPLTIEVGEALINYLRRGRPASSIDSTPLRVRLCRVTPQSRPSGSCDGDGLTSQSG